MLYNIKYMCVCVYIYIYIISSEKGFFYWLKIGLLEIHVASFTSSSLQYHRKYITETDRGMCEWAGSGSWLSIVTL